MYVCVYAVNYNNTHFILIIYVVYKRHFMYKNMERFKEKDKNIERAGKCYPNNMKLLF